MTTTTDDIIVNKIIEKVNQLNDVNENINELSKQLKPYREDKKKLIEELTDLFIKNKIDKYEVGDTIISLVDRTVKKKIDEETITKGLEEKYNDINDIDNVEKFVQVLKESIFENQLTEEFQSLKISKKKKTKTTRTKKSKK